MLVCMWALSRNSDDTGRSVPLHAKPIYRQEWQKTEGLNGAIKQRDSKHRKAVAKNQERPRIRLTLWYPFRRSSPATRCHAPGIQARQRRIAGVPPCGANGQLWGRLQKKGVKPLAFKQGISALSPTGDTVPGSRLTMLPLAGIVEKKSGEKRRKPKLYLPHG